ncbi:MAG: Palmitoyltransferase [Thelocarpon superellum]|nr:MAG: Palmitoyltransferase [Thelocarpon superellum]
MDHHCPWTTNCVSHTTYPHFIRFVFYAVVAMTYLEYFLYLRVGAIWQQRNLPSYLGPSITALVHLFVLFFVNSITLLALSVLLVRSLWSLGANTTTIEGWEIDRHIALVRRARILGGYAYGPDGIKVRVKKQEFPYDIGVWKNIKQGMGGGINVLGWFWPFASTPSVESGMEFEVNGFEDSSLPWPPIDPERIPRSVRNPNGADPQQAFTHADSSMSASPRDQKEAFRHRQEEDLRRRRPGQKGGGGGGMIEADDGPRSSSSESESENGSEDESEAGGGEEEKAKRAKKRRERDMARRDAMQKWTNSEGDTLTDYGVDEDAEVVYFHDVSVPVLEHAHAHEHQPDYKAEHVGVAVDEDVPLAILIERRHRQQQQQREEGGEKELGAKAIY